MQDSKDKIVTFKSEQCNNNGADGLQLPIEVPTKLSMTYRLFLLPTSQKGAVVSNPP